MQGVQLPNGVKVIGHRGDFYRAVENTAQSFQSALAAGVHGLELDVQLTKDGHLVAYHDKKLGGAGFTLTGQRRQKPVGKLTLSQLRGSAFNETRWRHALNTRAGQPVNPALTQTPRIPTLDDLLPLIPRDKLLFLEVKRPYANSISRFKLEKALVNWVEKNQLQHRAVILSFNPFSLAKVNRLNHKLAKGFLTHPNPWLNKLSQFRIKHLQRRLNLQYWFTPLQHTTAQIVKKCRQAGLKSMAWVGHDTIAQEQKRLKQVLSAGVEGVITNQPGLFSGQLPPGQP